MFLVVTFLADKFALCVWWAGWLTQVLKIQEENVQRLSLLSEKEIIEEQHRIRDVLGMLLGASINGKYEKSLLFFSTEGPSLTAFLLTRKKQPFKAISAGLEGSAVASVTDGEEEAVVGGGDRKETSLSGNKWLNMDVVERDKMEWMTDVTMENVTFTQVRKNSVCMCVCV